MKIITNSTDLEKEFLRLQESYSNYFWMSAWASTSSLMFDKLKKSKDKIKKIIVGLHFYQTHPDFIETFLNLESVRYIKQPEGTFHPKLFLFYNSNNDWEVIIGSANFTKAAFTNNTEIASLINSKDNDSENILSDIFHIIDSEWKKSKLFDENELADYKKIWSNSQQKLKSLSGDYGKQNKSKQTKSKPIHLAPVAKMDWDEFMKKVYADKYHSVDSRIKVLRITKSLFNKVESFKDLDENERKFIAGIPNKLPVDKDIDWGYFGSMKGAGLFKNRIIENDINISNGIDEIPLAGQITKIHYQRFLDYYTKSLDGNYLATATRLLAMKRPDVFVCLDNKNKSNLCRDFDVVKLGLDYERYWDDIILRIYDSDWWQNPKPKDKRERAVSDSRAAFLDSLYYVE